jgi:hypothetical protein
MTRLLRRGHSTDTSRLMGSIVTTTLLSVQR